MMRIAIAADHGGFSLKTELAESLRREGYDVADRQGVEDDDMNVFCLGGKVIGAALALELIETFLTAHFSGAPRHRRRLAKVRALEHPPIVPQGAFGSVSD
jgi:ribose 5-phosphate isomerase RpiB